MFRTQFTYTYFTNSLVSFKKISGRFGSGLNFFNSLVGSGLKLVGFRRFGFEKRMSLIGSGSKIALPAHL